MLPFLQEVVCCFVRISQLISNFENQRYGSKMVKYLCFSSYARNASISTLKVQQILLHYQERFAQSYISTKGQLVQKYKMSLQGNCSNFGINSPQPRGAPSNFEQICSYNKIVVSRKMMTQLQDLIKSLQTDGNYLRALKHAKKTCCIEDGQLNILTPSSVFHYIQRLQSRNWVLNEDKTEGSTPAENNWCDRWHPHEYKHFSWLVVGYFYIKNTPVRSFTEEDVEFFAKVFINKEKTFLQYHLLALIKETKTKREVWSKQETELLCELMNAEKYKGKWSEISYKIYEHTNRKHFRTSHKCREMWFNHLNPNVRHEKWSLEEDALLFRLVLRDGTKWAQISKAMDGVRTEHMVKNRFNSLIKKYSARYQRYSLKKLAEIIQKDLQSRLTGDEGSENLKQKQKQEEMDSSQIKVQNEEGKEAIVFCQHQIKRDIDLGCGSLGDKLQTALTAPKMQNNSSANSGTAQVSANTQTIFFVPELPKLQKQKQQAQKYESPKPFPSYEMAYQNIKMDNMQQEEDLAQLQWAALCKSSQVELIDYLGVQYEYKATIFSGTI